ncbi:MAG: cytochrome c oxidase subunit II [Alphaproteobacteria bacterium]|nr:cytochrome c oxidase subunit II [Alphaproteobacteria bacterium]MBU0796720.1 cytochrome c oxidase subunit II [Alphaproteobacteria bacterium]MBU0888269.1 cytochrome c oxidase subunit II [Alphaproteobacteria bacterium]MBU1811470.1 cytochrome c oxidase subunit II [Alphaproteobacteria bacterium]MBU2089995.1 cytochrome c oxidase subunit II [Alphaproteobacteria bacterium]
MIAVPLALSGCAGNLSALDPAGPVSQSIAELWWAMLLVGALIFVLVMALVLLTMLRPGFGSSLSPKGWIIAGGLMLPIPVITLLIVYALMQGERLLPLGGAFSDTLRIEARARQWNWEFHYPDSPGAPFSTDVLHIPVGRAIDIVATSEDVIHSFWVPRLGGKIDATPGHAAVLRLRADQSGSFGGLCAEYCGTGHTIMRFTVEAHEPAEYERVMQSLSATGTQRGQAQ